MSKLTTKAMAAPAIVLGVVLAVASAASAQEPASAIADSLDSGIGQATAVVLVILGAVVGLAVLRYAARALLRVLRSGGNKVG